MDRVQTIIDEAELTRAEWLGLAIEALTQAGVPRLADWIRAALRRRPERIERLRGLRGLS